MNLRQMIDETKEKIINILNESNLPIDIIDIMLENTLLTVRNQARAARTKTEENGDAD